MALSEGEPVSITVKRPSLGDFKRMYKAATTDPHRWFTILWNDRKGRPAFDAVNPYRETRGPRRQDIPQALSPKPDDEEEFLSAAIIICKMSKDEVAAKSPAHISIPAAFRSAVEELNLDDDL